MLVVKNDKMQFLSPLLYIDYLEKINYFYQKLFTYTSILFKLASQKEYFNNE